MILICSDSCLCLFVLWRETPCPAIEVLKRSQYKLNGTRGERDETGEMCDALNNDKIHGFEERRHRDRDVQALGSWHTSVEGCPLEHECTIQSLSVDCKDEEVLHQFPPKHLLSG